MQSKPLKGRSRICLTIYVGFVWNLCWICMTIYAGFVSQLTDRFVWQFMLYLFDNLCWICLTFYVWFVWQFKLDLFDSWQIDLFDNLCCIRSTIYVGFVQHFMFDLFDNLYGICLTVDRWICLKIYFGIVWQLTDESARVEKRVTVARQCLHAKLLIAYIVIFFSHIIILFPTLTYSLLHRHIFSHINISKTFLISSYMFPT